MATVVFERVASYSSEDPKYPARNLLTFGRKWRCRAPGEASACVILQTDQPRRIENIDIGNEHSAFVHVLVGRAAAPDADFQTILPASSFMTADESSRSNNTDRVRMFTHSDLVKPAADEKWDRIKVICSQPFNKRVQYGLAFFVVKGREEKLDPASALPPPRSLALGRFQLKAEDSDDPVEVGSLFAQRRHKAAASEEAPVSTQLNSAAKVSDTTEEKKRKDAVQPNGTAPSVSVHAKKLPHQRKGTTAGEAVCQQKGVPVVATSKVKAEPTARKRSPPATAPATVQMQSPNPKKAKVASSPKLSKHCKPFGRLLEGVVFVISGYVNPTRANLRNQALDMGAKYKQDWDSTCTHLICAFKNTPKFRQVQGQGCIVQKDWVEQCHCKRCRLPWRRFALDLNDFKQPESEEEIFEEVLQPSSSTDRGIGGACSESEDTDADADEVDTASGCTAHPGDDTEDEIERLEERKKKKNIISSEYTCDTEDEEGPCRPPVHHLPMPPLPCLAASQRE